MHAMRKGGRRRRRRKRSACSAVTRQRERGSRRPPRLLPSSSLPPLSPSTKRGRCAVTITIVANDISRASERASGRSEPLLAGDRCTQATAALIDRATTSERPSPGSEQYRGSKRKRARLTAARRCGERETRRTGRERDFGDPPERGAKTRRTEIAREILLHRRFESSKAPVRR